MSDQLEITPKQKFWGNVVSIIILVLALTVLALANFGVIDVSMGKIVLTVSFGAIALVCYSTAIIQKNPVSLWLGTAFAVPAIISALAEFTCATYAQLYPLYIATPGVGCLVAMIFSRGKRALLKGALVFICASAIFFLGSLGVLNMLWVWIIFAIYVTALVVYVVIYMGKGDRK